MNIAYTNSGQPEQFGFGFKTRNLKDILGFQFTLLVINTNKIEFVDGKKTSILKFYYQYYQYFPEEIFFLASNYSFLYNALTFCIKHFDDFSTILFEDLSKLT